MKFSPNLKIVTSLSLKLLTSWNIECNENQDIIITHSKPCCEQSPILNFTGCVVANNIFFNITPSRILKIAQNETRWIFCLNTTYPYPETLECINIIPLALYSFIPNKSPYLISLTLSQVRTYISPFLRYIERNWVDLNYLPRFFIPEPMFREGLKESLTNSFNPLKR